MSTPDLSCHQSMGLPITYRRLWLFSAPRQLGAYYYISVYIITVTRPDLSFSKNELK